MELGQIEIAARVKVKLTKLVRVLYEKEYFGFQDSAKMYVDKVIDTIYAIPTLKHAKTKHHKFGKFFVRHKANHQTTYYILFDKKDQKVLIKNVISNHEPDYSKYIL